mmetsp:Transcript_2790/g.7671  ORF Transcript_2790/g.7671 Transcript_2790/m.7671 type:complete len:218 (+) Transcript_2790:2521-3174(+)
MYTVFVLDFVGQQFLPEPFRFFDFGPVLLRIFRGLGIVEDQVHRCFLQQCARARVGQDQQRRGSFGVQKPFHQDGFHPELEVDATEAIGRDEKIDRRFFRLDLRCFDCVQKLQKHFENLASHRRIHRNGRRILLPAAAVCFVRNLVEFLALDGQDVLVRSVNIASDREGYVGGFVSVILVKPHQNGTLLDFRWVPKASNGRFHINISFECQPTIFLY